MAGDRAPWARHGAGLCRRGAQRIDLWTRYGWIRPPTERDAPRGFSLRRRKLDPLVRSLATGTPGVEAMLGYRAVGLLREGERVAGVELGGPAGGRSRVAARLTVAADGRDSPLARLARVPARVRPNARFAYFAYYRNLPLATGARAQMWLLDPDVAYAFPNDEGLTVAACFPVRSQLAAFRRDPERALRAAFTGLPDGPRIDDAERVSPLIGKLAMPNRYRRPAVPGLALAGDAALASDPVWGVGCGWALETAALLADVAGPSLLGGAPLDDALRRYALRHRLGPGAHHLFLCNYSRGGGFGLVERTAFRAGARDPLVARHLEAYGERRISPWAFAAPWPLARAACASARA